MRMNQRINRCDSEEAGSACQRGAAGFTILELLVASAVFAVILLVVAIGVIRFTDDYYKGITSSRTQATARTIMADISQAIQFSTSVNVIPAGAGNVGGLCVDNTLYSYAIGQQITDSAPNGSLHQGYHGLVASSVGTCSAGTTPSLPNTASLPAGSRELLGQHMRLSALDVIAAGNLYTIHVRVVYGDDDLLFPAVSGSTSWANEDCGGGTGSQFCAVSNLTTTVERRLL